MIKTIIALLALTSISGCGMIGSGDNDRWTEWKEVRVAEEETKQAHLQAIQNRTASPTVTITSQDSAGKPVIVSLDLAPVIQAATGRGQSLGVDITTTALPEGGLAESIRAVGGAAKDILSTPTATAFTVGAVISGALSETGGGGTHINGETVTATDSFNREEIHATGDGNTAYSIGRSESESHEEVVTSETE